MSARHSRTAALASAAAVLAAGVLAPAPAHAATGPAAPAASHSFTAKLEIGTGDARRTCTGALIDAHQIVTAASCFAADPQQPGALAAGAPPFKTTATIGRTDLSGTGGHVTDVVKLLPRADRDLVVAFLAEPATGITPVPLATTEAAEGDRLTVAGYGRTRTQWVHNRLHTAVFTVKANDGTALNITGASAGDAICKGDTGAPLLRETSGTVELVGVASRSWQGGCFGETETRTDAIVTRVDNTPLGNRLASGQRLHPGDALASASGTLSMSKDGDLSITSNAGKTLWSTGTSGNPGATALLDAAGNLTVRSTADAVLWESKTTAPGGRLVLQDRGNLVLRNTQGQSLWSSGSALRHDYNRNGRSDVAAWYDQADGPRLHSYLADAEGAFHWQLAPMGVPSGDFSASRVKPVTGDFNGDGLGDAATVHGSADGRVSLWTWNGRSAVRPLGGVFDQPFRSWTVEPGNWDFARMTPHSGDFNGDGRDDVAIWYDYHDKSDTIWIFTANAQGGFNSPVNAWTTQTGWEKSRAKTVTGDFNADGRDDIAALYDYADGSEKLWTFTATPATTLTPISSWSSTTWGDWNRTTLRAGDFNADGRDDVSAWYDYADGRDAVNVFPATTSGTFTTYYQAWSAPAGHFDAARIKQVTGDFNGDGRDDLAAMYNYAAGNVSLLTWTTRTDGKLNGHTVSATRPATEWAFDRTTLLQQQ
ncbi:trypsin-like serine protease [Streptomyces yaizuensis]|uniref:FG-GAP-like repeat-containing protein n=1 Tax=Streptomyces yaizuensis TaxID=2989713 RepID=A0ABQ5NY80_9ACTN|nr:trypsin-like serine protease [Streptomyces sp. YSPA8]GLF95182.1 FG-GAP-like repeat-containing protein [Streptomyces sp. YSPA8]